MTPGIRALVLSGSCFVMAAAGLGLRAQEKPANSQDPPVSFNRDILPILSNNCFACHGPDEKQREDEASTSTPKTGRSRRRGVIVPGNAAESLLVEHITSADPERADAAARVRAHADRRSRSTCCAGGSTRARSGTRTGPTCRRSVRSSPPIAQRGVGAQSDRSVHPRAARARRAQAVARSRQGDAAAPRHLRPDRPAADAGGGRRVPRRRVARRVREARRRAAAVAALRRADGDAVARRRALRRHARLSHRQPARDVAVARLGHRRVQPQPAVRPVRRSSSSPATCCRTRRASRRSRPASTATT